MVEFPDLFEFLDEAFHVDVGGKFAEFLVFIGAFLFFFALGLFFLDDFVDLFGSSGEQIDRSVYLVEFSSDFAVDHDYVGH